jgi:acyl-CoA oxidase
MMMKYTKVDRNGDFSIEGDTRVLYSVMMNIRTQLIYGAAESLSKGLTIALRYSCVRRQFKNTTGSKQETKLIDYQTQQMKLIPLLATSFGIAFSHKFVYNQYK